MTEPDAPRVADADLLARLADFAGSLRFLASSSEGLTKAMLLGEEALVNEARSKLEALAARLDDLEHERKNYVLGLEDLRAAEHQRDAAQERSENLRRALLVAQTEIAPNTYDEKLRAAEERAARLQAEREDAETRAYEQGQRDGYALAREDDRNGVL